MSIRIGDVWVRNFDGMKMLVFDVSDMDASLVYVSEYGKCAICLELSILVRKFTFSHNAIA